MLPSLTNSLQQGKIRISTSWWYIWIHQIIKIPVMPSRFVFRSTQDVHRGRGRPHRETQSSPKQQLQLSSSLCRQQNELCLFCFASRPPTPSQNQLSPFSQTACLIFCPPEDRSRYPINEAALYVQKPLGPQDLFPPAHERQTRLSQTLWELWVSLRILSKITWTNGE